MYTFLIIDDEPVVREGISENIDWESHGFTLVGACRDGREGIRAVDELQPNVVLTDICMPFVDGLELAAFIADRYPATKTILLTGYDEFEYAQEAVKLKVSDFLLKPITPDELRSTLDRLREELEAEQRKRRDLERVRQQLRESMPLLRERFLNRLLEGDIEQIEVSRRLQMLDIDLPGPCFTVLAIDPDRAIDNDDLTSIALQNAVEVSARERFPALTVRTQREELALILSSDEESTAVLRAIECAEGLSAHVKQAFDITVSIGVGSTVASPAKIASSYRDAKAALGQRMVLGPNQILTVEQTRDTSGPTLPDDEVSARALVIRTFKGGTAKQTESALAQLVALYRESGRHVRECRFGMQRLLADLLSTLELLGVQHNQIPEIRDDPFGSLNGLKTLEDMEKWFGSLHRSARAVLATRLKQHSVAKAFEAEEFIAEHFAEPDVSLTRLCRALSVSKSYFSPVFKAQTGMTFVEYLTRLRMERAQELLTSTDLKSYEIAERTGFVDAHYFSLTFRKQVGVTPTEFRETARGAVR